MKKFSLEPEEYYAIKSGDKSSLVVTKSNELDVILLGEPVMLTNNKDNKVTDSMVLKKIITYIQAIDTGSNIFYVLSLSPNSSQVFHK